MGIGVLGHYGNGLLVLVKGFVVSPKFRQCSSHLKIGLMISRVEPPSFLEIPYGHLQFPRKVRFPPFQKDPCQLLPISISIRWLHFEGLFGLCKGPVKSGLAKTQRGITNMVIRCWDLLDRLRRGKDKG